MLALMVALEMVLLFLHQRLLVVLKFMLSEVEALRDLVFQEILVIGRFLQLILVQILDLLHVILEGWAGEPLEEVHLKGVVRYLIIHHVIVLAGQMLLQE